MKKLIVILFSGLIFSGLGAPANSVTQYGITWTFSASHETGQYANGDWWVVGPVTLTRIEPDFDNGRNGWEVNPEDGQTALDYRISWGGAYDSTRQPDLPLTVQPVSSVIKAFSRPESTYSGDDRPRLKTASVLTVVAAVPPDSGATVFRPPYMSTYKPFYSTTGLRTDLLPSLNAANVGSRPLLSLTAGRHAGVFLDYVDDIASQYLRCLDFGLAHYGADLSIQTSDDVLNLYFNDPLEDKLPAVINQVQMGIDLYGLLKAGHQWEPTGGQGNGRKLPLVLAAAMLDDAEMKQAIAEADEYTFQEDGSLWFSAQADNGRGQILFGHKFETPLNETAYWQNLVADQASRTRFDPYGYIDGGRRPGESYQLCCNSLTFKYIALALLLMPELRTVWIDNKIITYADRWVTHGAWAQGDPCAPFPDSVTSWPNPPGYGVDYGPDPDSPGDCILDTDSSDGIGRFPDLDGQNANSGNRFSTFGNLFWEAYRDSADGIGIEERLTADSRHLGRSLIVYPNPFNPVTTIRWQHDGLQKGVLEIFDISGTLIRSFSLTQNRGAIQWNGCNHKGIRVASGIYFLKLRMNRNAIATKRLILVD